MTAYIINCCILYGIIVYIVDGQGNSSTPEVIPLLLVIRYIAVVKRRTIMLQRVMIDIVDTVNK